MAMSNSSEQVGPGPKQTPWGCPPCGLSSGLGACLCKLNVASWYPPQNRLILTPTNVIDPKQKGHSED